MKPKNGRRKSVRLKATDSGRRTTARLVFALSLAAMAVCAALFLSECWQQRVESRYWRRIAEEHAAAQADTGTTQADTGTETQGDTGAAAQADGGGAEILPAFRAFYARNPDIVGWLSVPGTTINFPVMQTKDDPEYYLRRNFDRQPSDSGVPFADYRCQVTPAQGFNTVIYLHNRLMAELYLQYGIVEGYYETHKRIRFDTLTESGTYEAVAALYLPISGTDSARLLDPWSPDDEQAYEFYNYLEVDSPEGFRRYADCVSQKMLYPDSAELSSRSPVITLVCCATLVDASGALYGTGRYAVIAQRVE